MISISHLFQFLNELKRNRKTIKFLKYQPQQRYFWSTKDDTLWIEILNTEYKAHRTQGTMYSSYSFNF